MIRYELERIDYTTYIINYVQYNYQYLTIADRIPNSYADGNLSFYPICAMENNFFTGIVGSN